MRAMLFFVGLLLGWSHYEIQKSDSPIVVTRSGNRLQTERERPNYVAGNAHVGKYLARHGIPGQPPLRQMIREDLFV